MMTLHVTTALAVLMTLAATAFAGDEDTVSRFEVELEGGAVWQTTNDVQIPNDENGTRFSLVDVLGEGPWPAARLYLTWNINARHGLRVLAAPLSATEAAVLGGTTLFEGESFAGGVATDATYQFNSYRLTYAYRFHDGSRWAWWIGFSAKLRDARIELEQDGTTAEKTDLGFVPLLHIRGWYRVTPTWRLVLDLDALAGGPGRAEDGSLKLCADVNERWSIYVGYRTLEGGADVDEVYNFAWLHYAVVSASYRFR